MELTEYKMGDIVEILWRDSYHSGAGWMHQEEFKGLVLDADKFIIHTCGYIAKETEDNIYLIQSYDGQEQPRLDASISIPKVSILKIIHK
jgi:hypothetical protein